MKVGINASRARSGGGVAHLVGIIENIIPADFDVSQVHVWSYPKLLQALPKREWLVKHQPMELEGSLLKQLW